MSNTSNGKRSYQCDYIIAAQNFNADRTKTIYTITDSHSGKNIKMTAQEIYYNDPILKKFGADDIRNISLTAICESEEKYIREAMKARLDMSTRE